MATECSRAGRGLLVATLGEVAILLAGCGSGHSHSSASRSSSSGTATSTSTLAPAPVVLQPPAQPPPAGASFGINVNRLFNDGTYSLPEISAQLLALQHTGVKLARSDALWERSEPAAPAAGVHHYDWSFDDLIVTELALHGMQWLPIIDYSAYWDESIPGQDHSPPASFSDYAAYAAAVAARYGTGGRFWSTHPTLTPQPVTTYEIWNEPDGAGFWLPGPQPDLYSDLYLTARAAILATQPTARVIVGGLTSPDHLPARDAGRAPAAAGPRRRRRHPPVRQTGRDGGQDPRRPGDAGGARHAQRAPVRDRVRVGNDALELDRLRARQRAAELHPAQLRRPGALRLRAGGGDPLHLGHAPGERGHRRGLVRHPPARTGAPTRPPRHSRRGCAWRRRPAVRSCPRARPDQALGHRHGHQRRASATVSVQSSNASRCGSAAKRSASRSKYSSMSASASPVRAPAANRCSRRLDSVKARTNAP